MRWFRFYDDAINDPKILRLSDANFRAWVTLLCLASKNDGLLPSTNDIALVLRMKPNKVAEWLATLTAAGLLDNGNGVFRPHNWDARQFKSDSVDQTAAERMRRYRDRKRISDVTVTDVTRNAVVTDTVPRTDTDTDTDTDTEQKKRTRASALAPGWSEADREVFWQGFPNKVGKADAMRAFDKATRKVSPDVLFPALQRYANKTDDRPFCNPATWLNQERWLDQPAANHNGRRTVQQAADDLLAKLRAFDEPPPDGVCDGTGQDAIRLLPPR